MKLAISERDKFLLCLVGSLLVVFLAYYFGFRNFSDRTSALESEISTLQVKYNDLKDKSDNIPKYKQDTENYSRILRVALPDTIQAFHRRQRLCSQQSLKHSLVCGSAR